MSPYPIPEIRRVALESVALAVKVTHDDAKVRTLSKPMDLYSLNVTLGVLVQSYRSSIHFRCRTCSWDARPIGRPIRGGKRNGYGPASRT